ncbi:hypothetical protein E2C01_034269 [Portunus trituberculatus]|uniref:Uncharacterized protein n=1 Tax=Portunus trituberculatus TaxID=210409 RepID=A0A5B7F832_PORTR|nr:hypothetical protein [Portunus trituberculatus]
MRRVSAVRRRRATKEEDDGRLVSVRLSDIISLVCCCVRNEGKADDKEGSKGGDRGRRGRAGCVRRLAGRRTLPRRVTVSHVPDQGLSEGIYLDLRLDQVRTRYLADTTCHATPAVLSGCDVALPGG